MGRNRKDSINQLPVDQYRKQIGKQDYKKSKTALKESKQRALSKQGYAETYKEMSLMVLTLVLVMVLVYLLFYVYLANNSSLQK